MNFIDVFFIILMFVCLIVGIVFLIECCVEDEVSIGIGCFVASLIGVALLCLPFLVIDKASGSTIGTITSVDKNFFGTTALYIKTTETNEEKYCIEFDEKLENQAKELIGKKVKISYGKRVGLYSTGKCQQAPIEAIELLED